MNCSNFKKSKLKSFQRSKNNWHLCFKKMNLGELYIYYEHCVYKQLVTSKFLAKSEWVYPTFRWNDYYNIVVGFFKRKTGIAFIYFPRELDLLESKSVASHLGENKLFLVGIHHWLELLDTVWFLACNIFSFEIIYIT